LGHIEANLYLHVYDPGVTLPPRGEVPSILVISRECTSLGVMAEVNIPSRDQSSSLRAKFTPRGKLILLKTGLWAGERFFVVFCYIFLSHHSSFESSKIFFLL
jgi:hypothetical protein